MGNRITELCQLIASERDLATLSELVKELDFALTEHNLQIQNKALYAQHVLQKSAQ